MRRRPVDIVDAIVSAVSERPHLDRPLFYRADKRPVAAAELRGLVDAADPEALLYIEDVTAAAVRLVSVRPPGSPARVFVVRALVDELRAAFAEYDRLDGAPRAHNRLMMAIDRLLAGE